MADKKKSLLSRFINLFSGPSEEEFIKIQQEGLKAIRKKEGTQLAPARAAAEADIRKKKKTLKEKIKGME